MYFGILQFGDGNNWLNIFSSNIRNIDQLSIKTGTSVVPVNIGNNE